MGTVGFPSGRKDSRTGVTQESSVVASIQDILRDAQVREEEEKLALVRLAEAEAQMRVEQAKREQERIEERARDDEEQRQQRAFDERKRQAELVAMHEGAIARAKTEAESETRLREISKQQEHERQLAIVGNDASKKRARGVAATISAAALLAVVAGGALVKKIYDDKSRIERDRSELKRVADGAEADARRFRKERDESHDPERIAELERKLSDARKAGEEARSQLEHRASKPTLQPLGRAQTSPAFVPPTRVAQPPCKKGDPVCS